MNAVAVIPARYASTRFPGKPLARKTGKYLIQHVYEQVCRARSVERVIIATDDERIATAASTFAAECVMTRADHPSGTDRVAEVAQTLHCDAVLNIQGDEPEIEPQAVDAVVRLIDGGTCPAATLACRFAALQRNGIAVDPNDPACVKVVTAGGRALYFSRNLIPYVRDARVEPVGPFLHLGVYAYRREFLLKLAETRPTPLERTEGLEQLRVLEMGYPMAVGLVDRACVGVDTPADYAAFVERHAAAVTEARR